MKISFAFHGGFLDGEKRCGDTDMRVCDGSARRYVFLTECGRVGKRFREFTPEQCEHIRELLDRQNTTTETMDAVVHSVISEIDPSHPPSCNELKKKIDRALRAIGTDLDTYLQKNQEETNHTNCELENIKSEVYEVASRKEERGEIKVEVRYVGHDTADTMYDL